MSGFRIRGGPVDKEKVVQPVLKPEPEPKFNYTKMELEEYRKKLETIEKKEKVIFENGKWKII